MNIRIKFFFRFAIFLVIVNTSLAQEKPALLIPTAKSYRSVEFNSEGSLLLSSGGTSPTIWDAHSGKQLRSFDEGASDFISYLSIFSPDSKHILGNNKVGEINIWDTESGKLLYTLKANLKDYLRTNSVQFSPDGRFLLITIQNTRTASVKALVWDAESWKLLHVLNINLNQGDRAQFSNDGKHIIVTGSEDIGILNVSDGSINKIKKKDEEALTFGLFGNLKMPVKSPYGKIEFSGKGKYILSRDVNEGLIIYDGLTGATIKKYSESFFNGIIFSPDERFILTDDLKKISIWNLNSNKLSFELNEKQFNKRSFNYKVDSFYTIVIPPKTSVNKIFGIDSISIESYNFSNDGKYLMVGYSNASIELRETETGKLIKVFEGEYGARVLGAIINGGVPFTANISKDNRYIIGTSSTTGEAYLWDVASGNLINTMKGAIMRIQYLALTPDGSGLIILLTNRVIIWDIRSGKIIHDFGNVQLKISNIEISTTGKLLAINEPGYINMWDLKINLNKFKLPIPKPGGYGSVDFIKFSPNERFLATASRSVCLWDIADGRLLKEFISKDLIKDLEFSINGRLLLFYDGDVIEVWNIENLSLVDSFRISRKMKPDKIRFLNDSSYLLTFATDSACLRTFTNIINLNNNSTAKNVYSTSARVSEDGKSLFFEDKLLYRINHSDYLMNLPREDNRFVGADTTQRLVYIRNNDSINFYNLDRKLLVKSLVVPGLKTFAYRLDLINNRIAIYESDGSIGFLDLSSGKILFSFILFYDGDYCVLLPSREYLATQRAAQQLGYIDGLRRYDFDQFDLQFNRPDKVIKALGNKDSALINAYKNAYYKRLRRMEVDTTQFSPENKYPELRIIDENTIESITKNSTLNLKIHAYNTESKAYLSKIFVYIDGVPVYGKNGLDISQYHKTDTVVNLKVKLTTGRNSIKISCLNNKSVESYKQSVFTTYQPVEPPKQKLWFIGIGIAKYKDSQYNLVYTTKDVKDLDKELHKKYSEYQSIVLLDSQATKENFKVLKGRLLKECKVDDMVILSLSGHGLIDKNRDFYLCTYDVDFSNPSVRGLSYEDIEWLLDSIPPRNKLVLMDACHSGELDRDETQISKNTNNQSVIGNVKEVRGVIISKNDNNGLSSNSVFELMTELFTNIKGGNGATIISAAAGTEYAFESNKWNNGVFTYCVLKGLLEKAADLNDDGKISISELQNYVGKQVTQLTNGHQRPTSRHKILIMTGSSGNNEMPRGSFRISGSST